MSQTVREYNIRNQSDEIAHHSSLQCHHHDHSQNWLELAEHLCRFVAVLVRRCVATLHHNFQKNNKKNQ